MGRKLLFGAIAVVLGFSTFGLGTASSGGGNPHDKVWVCHSTASESNPWILIHVKRSGWENGHMGADAHPGHPAEDQLFDDNPDKKAHRQGPARLGECGGPNGTTSITIQPN